MLHSFKLYALGDLVCEELEPTWNRLASAVSFSMYFLYSSMVVAPMHLTVVRLNNFTVKQRHGKTELQQAELWRVKQCHG